MCRYTEHEYKTHWCCLPCRVSFKHPGGWGSARSPENRPHCPHCGEPMLDLGRDFQPPRKDADVQWRKVELLVSQGVRFDSCGCSGPGYRPSTLAGAKHGY